MKFATALFVLGTLASPASADESKLNADRRLGFFCSGDHKDCKEDYYKSIWYRCCRSGVGPGTMEKGAWRRQDAPADEKYKKARCDNGCCCPVRGLDTNGWFSKETFYNKWQDACADDGTGSIYNKAFPEGLPEPDTDIAESRTIEN